GGRPGATAPAPDGRPRVGSPRPAGLAHVERIRRAPRDRAGPGERAKGGVSVEEASERVGMVLGTEDATPLTFWVAVSSDDAYLQLDDPVIVDTEVPGRGTLRIAGIVQDVRARHEGAAYENDVFRLHSTPVETAVAAQVVATRFEPEIFVPPMPGLVAY